MSVFSPSVPWLVLLLVLGELIPFTCCVPQVTHNNSAIRAVDAMGRRLAMSASSAVFIVGLIIQITSVHAWQQYVIGRLVGGWGVGALSVAVPMVSLCTPSIL